MNETSATFTQVTDRSSQVGELVAKIATASREQSHGIEQIKVAMGQIDQVVQRSATNAEELAVNTATFQIS